MTLDMKLKLLHVASSHIMGLTNQETQLALAYKNLGNVDLTVVSGENEQVSGSFSALRASGIPFVIIKGFDEHNEISRLIIEFKELVKKNRPDFVSVNTNWQLVIAALARLFGREKYKIIYTIHGFRHNHAIKSIVARVLIGTLLLLFADLINAPTEYVRKKFRLLNYKTNSVPLGEDELFFMKRKLPEFSKPLSFCFAGQFRKGKNQDALIHAFFKYREKTHDTQARLVLPGSGELLESCKALAYRLGVSKQVIFPGQLNRIEMVDTYLDCQIAIVATNSETFGHCVAEPLVMQRIVLSRPVGIAADVIVHGVNGYLFETTSQLVTIMTTLHMIQETDLIRISQKAGEVGMKFRWEEVAKKNTKLMVAKVFES